MDLTSSLWAVAPSQGRRRGVVEVEEQGEEQGEEAEELTFETPCQYVRMYSTLLRDCI